MDVEYWQMLLCVCWDNHIAFIILFFFDVVYHIYSYLDVEPSLPLVSTFHLPLSVSGARFQALTPLLVPPGSLVPCRCQFHWFHCLGHWDGELLSWACLSHSLYHCGGWGGWMGSLVARVSAMSRAVTKPCRLHCCGRGNLFTELHSSTNSPSTSLILVPVAAPQDDCNGLANGLSYFVQVHVQSVFHTAAEEIFSKHKWEKKKKK